jgi:ABC-type multidrug transport system ATPase subunit
MDSFQAIRPIKVEVLNLSVSLKSPKPLAEKVSGKADESFSVLQDISFTASPGQIIAIMGASGSGKTTLLHTLAGRTTDAIVRGSLLFDGENPKNFYENGSCGYVQQHDYLMPYLTVRETLRYAAELRLPSDISKEDKYCAVESVIRELGLKDCADTIIGDHWKKGISGGEMRRVSVGCQLLLNPSILFMDEVTTGLDAFSSYNLIETLKTLAMRGRTIFITLHQPRSDIFALFDSIILLSKGKVSYSGSAGETVLSYFSNVGYPCPTHVNPADHLIDITAIDNRDSISEADSLKRVESLINGWKRITSENQNSMYEFQSSQPINTTPQNNQDEIEADESATIVVVAKPKYTIHTKKSAGSLQQIIILIRRNWINSLRDNQTLWGTLAEVILVGFVFGAIFFQLGEDLPGVLTRRAAFFIVCTIQTYLILLFVLYKTTVDIRVFDREFEDKMYGAVPYVLAQFISQLPFNILFPAIYSVIMYFMLGLRTDELEVHLFRFTLANILGHWVVVAFAQFSVALARDFATSSLIANSFFTFFSLSTGFLVQLDSIPVYLKWLNHVSFLTYEYRLVSSNEFSDKIYQCPELPQPCRGNDVLNYLGIEKNSYIIPIVGLLCNFIGFMFLSILLLQFYKVKLNKHANPTKNNIQLPEKECSEDWSQEVENVRRVGIRIENISLKMVTKKPFRSNEEKTLLESISATFKPGKLTTIMGSSGTGKSTLLSVLCARKIHTGAFSTLISQGRILFNSKEETDPRRISSICSFVRQSDDHLLPALTCRETLLYAAKLRLPATMSERQKIDRAEHVMRILGLRHCENTIVGDELVKGLSGGERRRLSIGIQLLTDPSVLVVDEPTSGLE